MINIPLMRKVLEHITEHPEEHDQNVWAERGPCGTAYCMAGHTVVMTGHKLSWESNEFEEDEVVTESVQTPILINGEEEGRISRVAAFELGLIESQWETLFLYSDTVEDLWTAANEMTDGEIEIPEQFKESI